MVESPSTARCSTFRLSLATGLTFCLVCAELSVGHHSRCLTLLALSDQTVYNLLTLIVALVANQVKESYRDSLKGLYMVAGIFVLLLLNCSSWPCLAPA